MFKDMLQVIQMDWPTWQILSTFGVATGALIAFYGMSAAFGAKDAKVARMSRHRVRILTADQGLLRPSNADPTGLLKTLVPQNRKERLEVERQLAHAGLTGAHAVRNYYLSRFVLGICLPAVLLAVIWLVRSGYVELPSRLDALITGWSNLRVLQIVMLVVAIGFFGPAYWLKGRAQRRIRAIQEAFPNALDLIQISVEAGMGLDAAMIRVGNELELAAPEISHEFLNAQREIQAGRSREHALTEMAARTGVSEVVSFANVVLQSIQFGTSVAETLTTYAKEMRLHRELRAQEMANKMPVKMSAIMAALMLPALVLLTLGPVVIRYMHIFRG